MKGLNRGAMFKSLRARVSTFVMMLAASILFVLHCKDDMFLSGVLPSATELVVDEQIPRRLGRNTLVAHGFEAASNGFSILHEQLRNTKNMSHWTVMKRHIRFGGSIAIGSGILLLVGAFVAIRKKGMVEIYCPRFRGCCVWPPFKLERHEYAVLRLDADGGRRRKRSFYSPMPPLAGMGYLKLQATVMHLNDARRNAIDSILNAVRTVLQADGVRSSTMEVFDNAHMLLRLKNVGLKDRAILEERLNRMKRKRKCLLAVLFIAYAGVCTVIPYKARKEVSCEHGFFYETHLPFVGTFFFSKIVELLIYYFDSSLDGELGFRQFMLVWFISFFGYTDGYRDAMAVELAAACSKENNPSFNPLLAAKLYTTMFYSYYGGVVLLQWSVFGLLGICCDSSSAVLAKLLHMDALAACISLPSNRMALWYGLNIVITIGENIPQGVQQFIFVRFVRTHLFLTVAITFSAISSVMALIQACTRLAEAFGLAEAAARQAKSHARETYEWLSALEGHAKGFQGCQGSNRTTDWTSVLALHNRGVVLDFYDMGKSKLGTGSFGSVTKGVHLDSQMIRAIKSLDKGNQELSAVAREVQIMKELDHPNIIRLYETFHDRDMIYMVMELCEGGELFDAIANARGLAEEAAANVMQQAAQSVNYIHACQIVHRDIKPENFLLKRRGPVDDTTVVKLIDFGTSRGFEPSQVIQTQQGTPHYMAPEVIKESYSHLCDIWSLGVVMYCSLSCRVPFDGGNEPMIYRAIKNMDLKFPEEYWGEVSEEAKELIRKMLTEQTKRCSAKDVLEYPWIKKKGPERKPPDAAAVAEMLEQLRQFRAQGEFKKLVLMAIAYELPESDVEIWRDMFKAIDSDEDGTISLRELREALGSKAEDVNALLQGLDVDGNQRIDYTEFLGAMIDSSKYTNPILLWRVFQLFDRHGNGNIQSRELKMVLCQGHGDVDNDTDINPIFKAWDTNEDGGIDFAEFLSMMGV